MFTRSSPFKVDISKKIGVNYAKFFLIDMNKF
jgi:hypothetical protein